MNTTPTAHQATPETLSVSDAAAALGVGNRWLADQARAGRVPHLKLGIHTRFTPAQLDEIIAAHTRAPDSVKPHPWDLTPAAARRRRGQRTA